MKKDIIMFSVLIMLSLIFGCFFKANNIVKSEEKPLPATTDVEKLVSNSYEEMDKLPQKYDFELAQKNGDVVKVHGKDYNIEKLDKFIKNYKNKKENATDMVRITTYTIEGDAIICDLIIDSEGIKLMEDMTRDNFSNTESRKKTVYNVVDIYKTDSTEGISYMLKTETGDEIVLFFIDSKLDAI